MVAVGDAARLTFWMQRIQLASGEARLPAEEMRLAHRCTSRGALMLGIRRLRDCYFLLFYFWFRFDLFTKSRENKALGALGAVTLVQVWALFGGYWWGEILFDLRSLRREEFLAGVAVVFVGNYAILRSRGWEEFERWFVQFSARAQWGWMAVAGGANVAAFAVLLSAAIVARSAR